MTISNQQIAAHFDGFFRTVSETVATDAAGRELGMAVAFTRIIDRLRTTDLNGGTIMFVGNGGSAGIASHQAIDYSKNGGLRAIAFNDPAALTCLGNDLGYAEVFAWNIARHARAGDTLVAISSSGRSENILRAVAAARAAGCAVVTLSGFSADNPLRRLGDINLYVASGAYGIVEVAHLALSHAVLDLMSPSEQEASFP